MADQAALAVDWRLVLDGAVAVIAVAGFVLSLLSLAYTWWSGRPHVRVTMTVGFVASPGRPGPPLFIVRAYNQGRVPVALSSVGVDIYDHGQSGSTAAFIAPPPFSERLPHVLAPGRAWDYHIEPEEVLAFHVSDRGPVLGPFVKDEGGNHWSSRSSRQWLDNWARDRPVLPDRQ